MNKCGVRLYKFTFTLKIVIFLIFMHFNLSQLYHDYSQIFDSHMKLLKLLSRARHNRNNNLWENVRKI